MASTRDHRRLGAGLLAVCLVLALLGLGVNKADLPEVFDLDAEWTVPSLWSGGLLLAAAVAAWRLRSEQGWAVTGLAVLLAFMALDEVVGIHEALERRTGIDWEILYLPLVAGGGIGWLVVLRRLWPDRAAVAVWLLGAACWFVAQLLELAEWDGDVMRQDYYPKMYVEEGLEMAGSAFMLLGLLALARVRTARRSQR